MRGGVDGVSEEVEGAEAEEPEVAIGEGVGTFLIASAAGGGVVEDISSLFELLTAARLTARREQ